MTFGEVIENLKSNRVGKYRRPNWSSNCFLFLSHDGKLCLYHAHDNWTEYRGWTEDFLASDWGAA